MAERKPKASKTGRLADGKFAAGNPGKPKGARWRMSRAAEELMQGEADKLSRKCIDMALAGDSTALRLCMERIAPAPKERPIAIDLPEINGAEDHPSVIASIFAAVATGNLTTAEAQALSAVLEQHRRAVETATIISRIEALEGQHGQNDR